MNVRDFLIRRQLGDVEAPPPAGSSTRTEVRSPTRTSTEVRSPTRTSTEAYTADNVTVTGGAGAGATTSVSIHFPPKDRRAMNLFDDSGSSSDRAFARRGIAGCLGDALDDPGIEFPPSGYTMEPALPTTFNVTDPQGTGYTMERGVVKLAPVEVEATHGPSPWYSSEDDPKVARGDTWNYVGPSSSGSDASGMVVAAGALGLLGLALLGGKKKR